MKDSWCTPLNLPDGRTIYGSAARNKRIAETGGMDRIIGEAVAFSLVRANLLCGKSDQEPLLKQVGT